MGFDGEYEFMPISPVDHNAIPEAMKEFISECGMMGILPRNNFEMEKTDAEIINFQMCDGTAPSYRLEGDEFEDLRDESEKSKGDILPQNKQEKKADVNENEDGRVNRVLACIESNNGGVLKFLEVNGMSREKAKKFIKRVVRLSLRYEK